MFNAYQVYFDALAADKRIIEQEYQLLATPHMLRNYARTIIGHRWDDAGIIKRKEAESAILKNTEAAMGYFESLIFNKNKPCVWKELEIAIFNDNDFGRRMYEYCNIIGKRYPKKSAFIRKQVEDRLKTTKYFPIYRIKYMLH